MVNITGKISVIDELKGESFFVVEKIQDKIYYITTNTAAPEMFMLNLATKEKRT